MVYLPGHDEGRDERWRERMLSHWPDRGMKRGGLTGWSDGEGLWGEAEEANGRRGGGRVVILKSLARFFS